MSNRTGIVSENKELAELEVAARAQGWEVKKSGGGHIKWFAPDGETIVVTAMTPSRGSGFRKARADLVKAGLVVEGRTRHRRAAPGRVTPPKEVTIPAAITEAIEKATEAVERETSIVRAKFILGMGGATDSEMSLAYRQLPSRMQQALLRLIVADDEPSRECPCGRTFAEFLGAELHREKCDVATGRVSIEPKIAPELPAPLTPPDPRQGLETALKSLSPQSDTIPTATQSDSSEETLMMAVTDKSSTTCRECGRDFGSPQARGAHEASHRSGPCPHCGEQFSASGMGNHSAHCPKNPDRLKNIRRRKVDCPHCHKTMQQGSLYTHVKAHCPVAEHQRRNAPANGVVETPAVEGEDEFFDALLSIVTEGRPLQFSLSTMKVVNDWITATRRVLALLPSDEE